MPELSDLQDEVMRPRKDFINFYICWHDLCTKSSFNLHENNVRNK